MVVFLYVFKIAELLNPGRLELRKRGVKKMNDNNKDNDDNDDNNDSPLDAVRSRLGSEFSYHKIFKASAV